MMHLSFRTGDPSSSDGSLGRGFAVHVHMLSNTVCQSLPLGLMQECRCSGVGIGVLSGEESLGLPPVFPGVWRD